MPPSESRLFGAKAAGRPRRISPVSRGPNGRFAPVGSAVCPRYRTVEGPAYAGNESGTAEVFVRLCLSQRDKGVFIWPRSVQRRVSFGTRRNRSHPASFVSPKEGQELAPSAADGGSRDQALPRAAHLPLTGRRVAWFLRAGFCGVDHRRTKRFSLGSKTRFFWQGKI